MANPVFTIITVTYNAGQTLPSTLESVFGQTYPHIEYILVDGSSTDNTLALAAAYRDRFACFISEPDNGLYDAMNKGLKHATGDYVCFLNAGDCFHSPATLAEVAAQLSALSTAPDVVYGQTMLIDSTGRHLGMRHHSAPEHLNWKSFRHGMLVCHQAFWVKRALCEPYDLQYRFSSDVDWCIRILKQSAFCYYTRLTLINYLDEGMTTHNHKASLRERFRIMARHYGWCTTALLHLYFIIRAFGHRAERKL